MIWILSAGRSGSGWLSSIFAACNCRVVHEWFPTDVVDPDVISDTSLVHDIDQFVGGLSAKDVVIILDRDAKQRLRSVEKLLGKRDYSDVIAKWGQLKDAVRKTHAQVYDMTYEGLFDVTTREVIRHILFAAGFPTDNLNNFFGFMKHQRVTNNTSEALTKESLGL